MSSRTAVGEKHGTGAKQFLCRQCKQAVLRREHFENTKIRKKRKNPEALCWVYIELKRYNDQEY